MKPILEIMSRRCSVVKGVLSSSKEIEVYDANNELIRSFGSVRQLEKNSEKYLGVPVSYNKISTHCKNGKLYEGKYYFKVKENYIF